MGIISFWSRDEDGKEIPKLLGRSIDGKIATTGEDDKDEDEKEIVECFYWPKHVGH